MSDKLHEMVTLIKGLALELGRTPTKFEFISQFGNEHFLKAFKYSKLIDAAGLEHSIHSKFKPAKKLETKILFIDIETAPIEARVWKIFDENIGLNQIIKDWHLLSWSAKWLSDKEVMYQDQRNREKMSDDKEICKKLWELVDQADIVVAHNGDRFDVKKINTRFIENGMFPPSKYRTVDTLKIVRSKFGFTSNKLEYVAMKLCKKKKMTKRKFSGFSLWNACLENNQKAWDEMEKYNKQDVLVLEELYRKIVSWDSKLNYTVLNDGVNTCSCGSTEFKNSGYSYTNSGKFIRYKCTFCGKSFQDRKNMISLKETMKPI